MKKIKDQYFQSLVISELSSMISDTGKSYQPGKILQHLVQWPSNLSLSRSLSISLQGINET